MVGGFVEIVVLKRMRSRSDRRGGGELDDDFCCCFRVDPEERVADVALAVADGRTDAADGRAVAADGRAVVADGRADADGCAVVGTDVGDEADVGKGRAVSRGAGCGFAVEEECSDGKEWLFGEVHNALTRVVALSVVFAEGGGCGGWEAGASAGAADVRAVFVGGAGARADDARQDLSMKAGFSRWSGMFSSTVERVR